MPLQATLRTKGVIAEDGGCICKQLILQDADNDTDLLTAIDYAGRKVKGYPVLQAAISSITFKVFDVGTPSAPTSSETGTGTVTVSSSIFDTLRTAGWPADDVGYNFSHTVPASAFPTPDRNYHIDYKVTPASGQVYWLLFEVFVVGHYTS